MTPRQALQIYQTIAEQTQMLPKQARTVDRANAVLEGVISKAEKTAPNTPNTPPVGNGQPVLPPAPDPADTRQNVPQPYKPVPPAKP